MTYTSIVSDIKFLITGSSTGTLDYSVADICSNVNNWYNRVVSLIMRADSRWEWDDDNYETLPVATTNLVSGQADYNIASSTFLNLIRLEMKDQSGNAIFLNPISYEDKKGVAMTEWQKTNGTPHSYDKVGNSFILYPTPNYSYTAGLKAYFQRVPSYFESDDTTKTPGFNPLFHRLLSVGPAYDYCLSNGLTTKLTLLSNEITKLETSLIEAYSQRIKDEKPKMRLAKECYDIDDYEGDLSAPPFYTSK